MAMHSVAHVALRVDRLREAETFYRSLFALEVAFREAEAPDGWWTLPGSAGWDDAERAGIDLGLVMLYRGGLRLALEAVDAVTEDGQLSHVGVFVDEDELDRLRRVATEVGCKIVFDHAQALTFDDRFGVRWELNSFPYDDPPSLSTGVRTGRWLEVPSSQASTSRVNGGTTSAECAAAEERPERSKRIAAEE